MLEIKNHIISIKLGFNKFLSRILIMKQPPAPCHNHAHSQAVQQELQTVRPVQNNTMPTCICWLLPPRHGNNLPLVNSLTHGNPLHSHIFKRRSFIANPNDVTVGITMSELVHVVRKTHLIWNHVGRSGSYFQESMCRIGSPHRKTTSNWHVELRPLEGNLLGPVRMHVER